MAWADARIGSGTRRLVLGFLAVAFGLLSFVPRLHTARVKIMPPQSSSAGLGSLLNQLGGLAGFAPLLSSRQPVEVYLLLARSHDVALDVVRRAELRQALGIDDPAKAVRKLENLADVHSLRGGVIEVEVQDTDPKLALRIAEAYALAFQDRLTSLARDEAGRKRALMTEQLRQAGARLAGAEAALSSYRTSHNVASPEAQLGSSVSLLAALRARLQAKEVERAIVRRFATEESFDSQRVESEITGLKRQIERAESGPVRGDPFGFPNFARGSSEYLDLYRNLKYAEALHEVYSRYLEAVNMEEVSASINAQIVESPYLDPSWTLRTWALGIACLTAALGAILERRDRRARATRTA